jgi:hypothetical protein
MKGVDDEVLRPMIQEIEILSHSLLSSIIDTIAGTMSREVVAMQHEGFRRNLQYEVESGERKQQSEALVAFIRKLNTLSTGRRDWYVVSDLSCRFDGPGATTSIVHIIGVATTPWDGRGEL